MQYMRISRRHEIYHLGWRRDDLLTAINKAVNQLNKYNPNLDSKSRYTVYFKQSITESYPILRRVLGPANVLMPATMGVYDPYCFQWKFVCEDVYYKKFSYCCDFRPNCDCYKNVLDTTLPMFQVSDVVALSACKLSYSHSVIDLTWAA